MFNRFVLSNSILGGVYSINKRTYTFFLPGGCCVVPEYDLEGVDSYEKFKECPEDFIQEVMMHGLNTNILTTKNNTPRETLDSKTITNKYLKIN